MYQSWVFALWLTYGGHGISQSVTVIHSWKSQGFSCSSILGPNQHSWSSLKPQSMAPPSLVNKWANQWSFSMITQLLHDPSWCCNMIREDQWKQAAVQVTMQLQHDHSCTCGIIRYYLYTPEPSLMWLWYNVRYFCAGNNTIAAIMYAERSLHVNHPPKSYLANTTLTKRTSLFITHHVSSAMQNKCATVN